MTSPDTPRRRNAKATRERIARAALQLFTSAGYHASTTPAIARAAGVAEGSIYRHFESKQHLLNELYRAAARALLTPIEDPQGPAGCRARLRQVAESWCDLAERDPAAVRLVFFSSFPGVLDPRTRDLSEQFRRLLTGVIVGGKSAGEVRPGVGEVWTDVWLTLVKLAVERITLKAATARDASTQLVLEAAWEAIGAPPTPTA